jgi:hypothetical protein
MSARRVRVWAAPIQLAVVSAIGLVAALLSDGAGDVVGWSALAVPVGVIVWFALPMTQRRRRSMSS